MSGEVQQLGRRINRLAGHTEEMLEERGKAALDTRSLEQLSELVAELCDIADGFTSAKTQARLAKRRTRINRRLKRVAA